MKTIIERLKAEVNRQAKSIDTATGDFAEGRRMEQRIILSVLSDLEKECEKPTNIDFEQELYKHFGQVKDFTLGMRIGQYFYELGQQSKEQPLLPGFENEQPGIPGKDFVPVAWCDALEQYGIWRIVRVEQPVCEGLEEEIVKVCDDFVFPLYGLDDEFGRELINKIARHFAQWGAEHRSSLETPKDLESYAQKVEDYYDVGEERGYLCVHRGEVKDVVIAGAQWQKEQMMKEAVEGEVVKDISNKLAVTAKINLDGFKFGDKVCVIVCKKED